MPDARHGRSTPTSGHRHARHLSAGQVASRRPRRGPDRRVLAEWADDGGLPHYGHLLTGYVKDVIPRFQTMRGHKVDRRFGWDCHGLPAELEAERQLGVKDKPEIDAGLAKFNDFCRASVLRYTGEWRDDVTRQARWVDFDNDYKTLDLDFMESVMWAFKSLYRKGPTR